MVGCMCGRKRDQGWQWDLFGAHQGVRAQWRDPHRAQQVLERAVRYIWDAARGWEHSVIMWGAATVQRDSGIFVGHHEGLRTQWDL